MYNAFNAVAGGGGQTYFTTTGVSSQNVQDCLRLTYRGDTTLTPSVPSLATTNSNVIVWDAQASIYSETAYPTAGPLVNGGTDNLHPSGYQPITYGICSLLAAENDAGTVLANAQQQSIAIERSLAASFKSNLLGANTPQDLTDWYPIYPVVFIGTNYTTYQDVGFNPTYLGGNDTATALDAFGVAGTTQPGLCVGDVIVWNAQGVYYSQVVRYLPLYNQGGGTLRWATTAISPDGNAPPAALILGKTVGTIYRHRYAYSSVAKNILATTYQAAAYNARTVLKNAYRFQVISVAAGGVITIGSIPGEFAANGQQLHQHTVTATDVLCLAGAEGATNPVGWQGLLGWLLTGFAQGAVTGQQYQLTLSTAEFRNYIGGQGFLLSST
jgi:hypothetical protein